VTIGSKKIALGELQKAHGAACAAADILDGKLQNILNYSSIVVTIPAAVMASVLLDRVGIIFWTILAIVLILYLFNFFVIICNLSPGSYAFPISGKKGVIEDRYYNSTEELAVEQAILDHLETIPMIQNNNENKIRAVRASLILMGVIVFLLLIAIPLGLLHPTPTLSCFFHLSNCIVIKP